MLVLGLLLLMHFDLLLHLDLFCISLAVVKLGPEGVIGTRCVISALQASLCTLT